MSYGNNFKGKIEFDNDKNSDFIVDFLSNNMNLAFKITKESGKVSLNTFFGDDKFVVTDNSVHFEFFDHKQSGFESALNKVFTFLNEHNAITILSVDIERIGEEIGDEGKYTLVNGEIQDENSMKI